MMQINNIEEYLHFIKEFHKKSDRELWYRGHWSNGWELKPNLYRSAKMITNGKGQVSVLKYDFVDFKSEFLKFKNEISRNSLFDTSGLNDFQIMFIAQHYGLLTPILDWTTDPLVALFFALDGKTYNDGESPVIYIMQPGFCNEWADVCYKGNTPITEPICIDGDTNDLFNKLTNDLNKSVANHIPIAIYSKKDFSHRICRQSGRFTLHGAVGLLNYRWDTITIEGKQLVDKIKINVTAIEEMREYLFALNITTETIYREIGTHLDNICASIKYQELEKFINSSNKSLMKHY